MYAPVHERATLAHIDTPVAAQVARGILPPCVKAGDQRTISPSAYSSLVPRVSIGTEQYLEGGEVGELVLCSCSDGVAAGWRE